MRYYLFLLSFSFLAYADVNDFEAAILNNFFGKNFEIFEWNNELTLSLETLPPQQFPEEFKKIPRLIAVDLMHPERPYTCENSNLRLMADEIKKRFNSNNLKKHQKLGLNIRPFDLCLGGQQYSISKRLGRGCEGDVYQIKQKLTGKEFALKIYKSIIITGKKNIENDLLVFKKARASLSYLAVPLLIHLDESYAVFPLLNPIGYHEVDPAQQILKVSDFQKTLNQYLDEDGLEIGDSKPNNCMVDSENNLIRIDFGSLKLKITNQ